MPPKRINQVDLDNLKLGVEDIYKRFLAVTGKINWAPPGQKTQVDLNAQDKANLDVVQQGLANLKRFVDGVAPKTLDWERPGSPTLITMKC